MIDRPAYEEVTITYGGNAVVLRPSLRAATILNQHHGIPQLFRALDDLNITIISEIVLTCAFPRQDGAAFLSRVLPGRPLMPFFAATIGPLARLVTMLTPAPDPKAKPSTGKPTPWAEYYSTLYDRATGWLGWTPEQAWDATPTEIDRAYAAHIAKLKAIHGSADDQPDDETDPEQAAANEAAGLDPAFDRAGLQALKSSIGGGL